MPARAAQLLILAVLAGAGGCGGVEKERPDSPLTILQDDAVLLHEGDDQVAAALDDLRELGVDWVRVTAGWSVIAPEPESIRRPEFDASDPGAYPAGRWAPLDRLVAMARERGLRIAIDIAFFAPRWAVSRRAEPVDRQRYGIDPDEYADFAEAVAERYPGVAAFTIWNEPNFRGFLLPQWRRRGGEWIPAAPHLYREMVTASYERIEEAAPGALILIGGTAPIGSAEPDSEDDGVQPLRFLRELACVDATLRPLDRPECEDFEPLPGDGFAHHPLPVSLPPWQPDPEPDNVRTADVARLTRLLARLHAAGRTERQLPVYLTEYGYQSDPPDPTAPVSPETQARYLAEAERIFHAEPGVVTYPQFLLRDIGPRPADSEKDRWADSQMGLRFPDGRPKPAERSFGHVLSARRAGERRVSFWLHLRAAREPREVRIARRGPGGGFEPVGEPFHTDGRGYAERELSADPAAVYRLEVRADGRWTAPGLPVPVRR